MESEHPRLDKTRHVKYWTRCLKTLLPHHYTGNESNRMYLAFFIISALDILDAWDTVAKESERQDYRNWIYHCQHPGGGFRMWPGTDFGDLANDENAKWDPANVPATYFALSALTILGDDLQRVKRRETLDWLRDMQRPDGSFGETLVDGHIEGGRDPRFGYCATGARYILRGLQEGPISIDGALVEDINVDALMRCIQASETYDGGIADESFHEPHAGYTFCSLGCASFVDRVKMLGLPNQCSSRVPSDPELTMRWLVSRQTDWLDPDAELDGYQSGDAGDDLQTLKADDEDSRKVSTTQLHQSPDKTTLLGPLTLDPPEAGMNGRPNKTADTCYAWWVGASLAMLGQPDLFCKARLRRYLLVSTQHAALGGFGKFPGDLPDLYHSYLGLASLGLIAHDDVKEVDATMCMSKEASGRLSAIWKRWNKPC
ncbi:related to geranylgeranyltransferase Type I, beta subunit [Lecanosticta acicola]|uniref:Related to geranylgeranyltransferase Type I, beta subunit n=1 Tax=Lecanosticta acicola TaxID=111012 RepID=A0AAI9E807_9PEZI|nr:related to geranylgeranyltransferase Type I, beta subunit [Lecanosticta acicola]